MIETVILRVGRPSPDYELTLIERSTGATFSATLQHEAVEKSRWPPALMQARFDSAIQPTPDLTEMGKELGCWVYRGDVGERLHELGRNLRVQLDVRAPDLALLPWELLRCNRSPDFVNPQRPFLRFHDGAEGLSPMHWPMKVLVLVGAAEVNDIAVDEEVRAIERYLHPLGHSIDREVLWRPGRRELFSFLEEFSPDVLLFAGHAEGGGIPNQTVLHFQGKGNLWDWSSGDLETDLRNIHWVPRLVILNACHTAARAASFRFSDTFLEAGCRACITMQGDVKGEQAGIFSSSVLKQICEGRLLDAAVARARFEILTTNSIDHRDWALPVLSMSDVPEQLFAPRPESPQREILARATLFRDTHVFADRRDQRRRLRSDLSSGCDPTSKSRLVAVVGGDRSGKTHLVKWCLANFALLYDARVQYLPQSVGCPDNSVSLMRRICRAEQQGPDRLPQEPFYPFYWTLNATLAGKPPGDWNGAAVRDANLPFDPNLLSQYEHAIPTLYNAFCSALREAAKQVKVVIAFDNFLDRDNRQRIVDLRLMRDEVIPYLLRPIAEGKLPGVMAVLVMVTSDCAYYGIDELVPQSEWLEVDRDFPSRDQYPNLCHELLWYPNQTLLDEGLQDLIDAIKQRLRSEGAAQGVPVSLIAKLWQTAALFFGDPGDKDDFKLRAKLEVRQMG